MWHIIPKGEVPGYHPAPAVLYLFFHNVVYYKLYILYYMMLYII